MFPMTDKEICILRIAMNVDAFTIRRFHDSGHTFFRQFTDWGGQVWQPREFIHTKISMPLLILLAQEHGDLLIEIDGINTSLTIAIAPQTPISGIDFNV